MRCILRSNQYSNTYSFLKYYTNSLIDIFFDITPVLSYTDVSTEAPVLLLLIWINFKSRMDK